MNKNINSRISNAFLKDYIFGDEKSWSDIADRLFKDDRIPVDMQLRLKDGFINYFTFATPIMLNFNTKKENNKRRGFPISCFKTKTYDNMGSIAFNSFENQTMLYHGGGVGSDFDSVLEVGHEIKNGDAITEGVIPFINSVDRMVAATSQGKRRGVQAITLGIHHPEILEFIRLRDVHIGELQRKCSDIFPSILITDEFMEAKENLEMYNLYSRRGDKVVVDQLDAFEVWAEILQSRKETGLPFIVYKENFNTNAGDVYNKAIENGDIELTSSNVCTEIALNIDEKQSAVCCLSSLNLANYDLYKNNLDQIIYDISFFLDLVLEDFVEGIDDSEPTVQIALNKVKNFVINDGSIGIGAFGLSDYFQLNMMPFDSLSAKYTNIDIFKKINESCLKANIEMANLKGARPFPLKYGFTHRFSTMQAVAPTGSTSKIAGASPSVEPRMSNLYTEKNDKGSFVIENPYLNNWMNYELTEEEISYVNDYMLQNDGSIAGIRDDIIPDDVKDVFKTTSEISMYVIIDLAADRQKFIDQSQSINVFFHVNAELDYIDKVHTLAWKKGVKSLYYNRPINGGGTTFSECAWCV